MAKASDRPSATPEQLIEVLEAQHEKFNQRFPGHQSPDSYKAYPAKEVTYFFFLHLGFEVPEEDERYDWGGNSAEVPKQVNVASVKRALDKGVKNEVIVRLSLSELRTNGFRTNGQSSTGTYYTTKKLFDAAQARTRLEARNKRRYELGEKAKEIIWSRYSDEVEAEYNRLCDEAGLSHERENLS